MNKYPDFWAAFLNGLPLGTLFAAFIFALVGLAIRALVIAQYRDPASPRTPQQWSWAFWRKDNLPRLLNSAALTILVIFVSIRFVNELTGKELSMFYALGLGLFFDWAVGALIKKAKP